MSEPVKQNVLDVIESAGAWLKADDSITLATVVDTWGSAPVPIGGQMLVGKDGKADAATKLETDYLAQILLPSIKAQD